MSSFNGTGTFVITGTGLPYQVATVIDETVANQLNTDLATGLTTCITKDGQTTTTAQIPFVLGASFAATTFASGTANLLCGTTSIFNNMDNFGGQIGATRGFFSRDNAGIDWGSATYMRGFDSSNIDVMCGSNGVTLLVAASAWSALSDERHKTPLIPFPDALERVSKINAGTGRYLTDPEDVSRSFLTAQSVQAVLPEAVSELNGSLQLRYTEVLPLLVAALAEVQERLRVLESR